MYQWGSVLTRGSYIACFQADRGIVLQKEREHDAHGTFILESARAGRQGLTIFDTCLERKDCIEHKDDLVRALIIGHPYTDAPLAWLSGERAVRMYKDQGTSFLSGVHGYFTLIMEDRERGRSHIATGRTGGYGVFCAKSQDSTIFSDSIEVLAKRLGSLTINKNALLEFLELGFMLGEKTHFEEIRRIRPSTLIEIGRENTTERQYWRLSREEGHSSYKRSDFIETFTSHVRNAFSISDVASLSMTAGFDSRAILACCSPGEEHLRCFTIGNRQNDDVRVAKAASKVAGYEHTVYPVNTETVRSSLANLSELLRIDNGSRNCFHFVSFAEQAYRHEANQCDVFMTGNGAALFKIFFKPGNDLNSAYMNASEIRKKLSMARDLSSNFFKQGVLEAPVSEVLNDSIDLELNASGESDRSRTDEWLYLNSRVANYTAVGPAVCGRYMRLWDPWLFTPIMETAFGMPTDEKTENVLARAIIAANNRSLARIPANRRRVELERTSLAGLAHSALSTSRKNVLGEINRLSAYFCGRGLISTYYSHDYQRILTREFSDDLMSIPEGLGDTILAELIEEHAIRTTIDSMNRGDLASGYLMTNLMCIDLWFQIIERCARLKFA